ncbi:hypothetical protein C8Q79DRAFT_577627 [Trametes meyenii]|nr:hypothetical protein C8Q79DRAFT_577627 [Trametes meyenii]
MPSFRPDPDPSSVRIWIPMGRAARFRTGPPIRVFDLDGSFRCPCSLVRSPVHPTRSFTTQPTSLLAESSPRRVMFVLLGHPLGVARYSAGQLDAATPSATSPQPHRILIAWTSGRLQIPLPIPPHSLDDATFASRVPLLARFKTCARASASTATRRQIRRHRAPLPLPRSAQRPPCPTCQTSVWWTRIRWPPLPIRRCPAAYMRHISVRPHTARRRGDGVRARDVYGDRSRTDRQATRTGWFDHPERAVVVVVDGSILQTRYPRHAVCGQDQDQNQDGPSSRSWSRSSNARSRTWASILGWRGKSSKRLVMSSLIGTPPPTIWRRSLVLLATGLPRIRCAVGGGQRCRVEVRVRRCSLCAGGLDVAMARYRTRCVPSLSLLQWAARGRALYAERRKRLGSAVLESQIQSQQSQQSQKDVHGKAGRGYT